MIRKKTSKLVIVHYNEALKKGKKYIYIMHNSLLRFTSQYTGTSYHSFNSFMRNNLLAPFGSRMVGCHSTRFKSGRLILAGVTSKTTSCRLKNRLR